MPQERVPGDLLNILRMERRAIIDRMRQTRFSTLKAGYSHTQIIPFSSYSPWLDDEYFVKIHALVQKHTMVDVYRCFELYLAASQLKNVPGELVEVGVWRGGTAALIASVLPERPIHLFDTFEGVAKAGDNDTIYTGGEHSDTGREVVETLFSSLGLSGHVHMGIFPDDTLDALPAQIALGHIDVDTYLSARDCFHAIWPRVPVGGIVIFDDYGVFGCEGVAQAVNELRQAVDDAWFIHNVNGHAILIKRD